MKLKNYLKISAMAVVVMIIAVFVACQSKKPGLVDVDSIGNASSPTEAYIMLYSAVKSKNTDAIKKMMSQSTLKFVEGAAGQQNKTVAEVLENGLFASTINPEMPEIRDERIKDDKFGVVEVFVKNTSNYEQVYFIKEEDGWKVAVGDLFAGSYQNPGKSKAQIQADAANVNGMIPYAPNINGNFTSGNKQSGSANVKSSEVKPEQPPESKKAGK